MMSRLDVLSLLALMTAAVIGGCSLPVAGPHDWDIVSGQYDPKNLIYALVRVTPRTVDILAAENRQIAGEFPDRRGPEAVRFGVGDVLGITIFESGPGGLFTAPQGGATPGNYITLPNQAVDDRGNISVPYAGALRAKGRTAIEVQQAITSALKDSALKPQALVSLVDQRASSYSVLGEVKAGGQYAVSASGERLLEAIARAGGLSGPGNGAWVLLEREGRRALVPFGAIVDVPANNIYVRAHDIIYVFNEPQTFLAFGAVGTRAAGEASVPSPSLAQGERGVGCTPSTLGASRCLRHSRRRAGYPTPPPIRRPSSCIVAKRATLRSCWEWTSPSSTGRLSRSFIMLICAIQPDISLRPSSRCAIKTLFMFLMHRLSNPAR